MISIVRDLYREFIIFVSHDRQEVTIICKFNSINEQNFNKLRCNVGLDLIMPDIDGGRTFDQIREICPLMPVILSSGYAIDGQAAEIMARGCNGFIQKPFNLLELSQKIRSVIDKKG